MLLLMFDLAVPLLQSTTISLSFELSPPVRTGGLNLMFLTETSGHGATLKDTVFLFSGGSFT